jgi:hypothetical protein
MMVILQPMNSSSDEMRIDEGFLNLRAGEFLL